jgi:hypothetical protein
MDNELLAQIKLAVIDWAQEQFSSQEVVVGTPERDESEEDDADRYLVAFAVRTLGYWLVAEVWVNHKDILSINDLGEGLPLEDASWPWASAE